jgi:hypothetical protein
LRSDPDPNPGTTLRISRGEKEKRERERQREREMMRVRDEAWAMVTDAWPLHRLKSTLEDLSLPPWLPGTKHITTVVTLVQKAPHYLFSTVSSDPVDTALSEEGGEEKECSDVQSLLGGWVQLDAASYSHALMLLSLLVLLVATVILYRRRFPPKIHGLPCIPDDRYHRHIYTHTNTLPPTLPHTHIRARLYMQ